VDVPDFEELCELEPRLRALEADVRAVRDEGRGTFFCSNFVWLPLNARLRGLIGVARKGEVAPGGEGVLFDGAAYEVAYRHLSPLMPPCRDCGCRVFQPVRDRQLAHRAGERDVREPEDAR
jgi:hypothetical protein